MDLPINDKELDMIVWMLEHVSGDGAEELHEKLKLVKEVRDKYPGGPSKKILREKYGYVA